MSLFDKFLGKSSAADAAHRQAMVDASASAHEAARLLRAPTALMQLSEPEALTVVGFMRPRRYKAGATVIRQGEADDNGATVDTDSTDNPFKASVGASLIWDSPFGPLRGDFGYVLSKATGDRSQVFQLTLQSLL